MLAYLKEPMAHTTLDGYRIYGRKFSYGSFGSTDLPLDTYKKHKDILEDGEYTKEWLEKKYNKEFPDISFTPKDLNTLDFKLLLKIASLIGVKLVTDKRKTPTIKERNAIKKSIIIFLNRG